MILINKQEKDLVLKNFPNTRFVRTCKHSSKRHKYWMPEEKDQLRFLSGLDKTQKDYNTNTIHIVLKGSPYINVNAIRALELLLLNNIKYYKGEMGGMNNGGELLREDETQKSLGSKKFCEFELNQLRKKYKGILRK